jgi:hypothetical protein
MGSIKFFWIVVALSATAACGGAKHSDAVASNNATSDKAAADKPTALTEADLVGTWSGTVVTTMRTPTDHATSTEAKDDVKTTQGSLEIVRRNGKLFAGDRPVVVTAGGHGELVDRSQEDTEVVTYSMTGDQLRVETETKGHFGGTSVGSYRRVR